MFARIAKKLTARCLLPVKGQALVVFALFMGFVFLGVLALAVDVAVYHGERRKLQNTADAAALAGAEMLRDESDRSTAEAKAREYITKNRATVKPTDTYIDTVTAEDESMRVSLQYEFDGYFSKAIGVPKLTVKARSRAGLRTTDTLLPIAIKRYSEGDPSIPLGERRNPPTVTDHLCESTSSAISLWHRDPEAYDQCGDRAATEWAPGPDFLMIGQRVEPNEGSHSNSFNGWLAPTFDQNASENEAVQYVRNQGGYPVDDPADVPQYGDQTRVYPGVHRGQIMVAMASRFRPGQRGVVVVFSGITDHVGSDSVVTVLGYVVVEITSVSEDDGVEGHVISRLTRDLSSLRSVKNVSLIAW